MKLSAFAFVLMFSSLSLAQQAVDCFVAPACDEAEESTDNKCYNKVENDDNAIILRRVNKDGQVVADRISFDSLQVFADHPDQVPTNVRNTLESYCQGIQTTESKTVAVDSEKGWKIRFHFGFTRTNYRPTDVKIDEGGKTTVIKGFQFDERTSGDHYNPGTWKNAMDALRWIDEPSNTITISFENKNNAIYLTAFHPKFLKTYYVGKDNTGETVYTPVPSSDYYLSNGTDKAFGNRPDGQKAFEIQNTHQLMNYQIGYGRKFALVNSPGFGKLTYAVRTDLGVMVGAARSIEIDENGQYRESTDKLGVQGYTFSLGHRLDYQRGRTGIYVEQKGTTTEMEHKYFEGTAQYNLVFSTITFGATFDIFRGKRNK